MKRDITKSEADGLIKALIETMNRFGYMVPDVEMKTFRVSVQVGDTLLGSSMNLETERRTCRACVNGFPIEMEACPTCGRKRY